MKSRRKTAGCINTSAGFVERAADLEASPLLMCVSSYRGGERRHVSTGELTLTQHRSVSIFFTSVSITPPSADSFSFAVTQVLPAITGDSD